MSDTKFIEELLLTLFRAAEEEENREIPHSKESIAQCIKTHNELVNQLFSPELDEDKHIDIMYQLFQHTIVIELQKITWELDKEGFLETGVNKEGDICFTLTSKGLEYFNLYS